MASLYEKKLFTQLGNQTDIFWRFYSPAIMLWLPKTVWLELHYWFPAGIIKNRLISEQWNKDVSVLQEAGHRKNTVVLIFWLIQCLHLMYAEVAWVLESSETQDQPQVILYPDYLSDSLFLETDFRYLMRSIKKSY